MRLLVLAIAALALSACASTPGGQGRPIYTDVPSTIDPKARYLFHMHGTVVEEQGPWGRNRHGHYKYYPTVEALADRGFIVISEVRKPTEVVPYALKVAGQFAKLRAAGVPAGRIAVTGVSKGGFMTLLTTVAVANPDVRFVILAGCLRDASFARALAAVGNRPPQGRVLSLYDYADPDVGSCASTFPPTPGLVFEESVLQTGRDHGLFFSPDPIWVDRVAAWVTAP
ncbi:MAG: hypothetical protein HY060_03800 [Proteobacteria bacterium]|nr:hypothetical protein [Pseudomonadota bacterium]